MGTRFEANPELLDELASEPGVARAMLEVAENLSQTIADMTPERTGAARAKISAIAEGRTVRVLTEDRAGHLIEWGSANNPAYAPFRRGVERSGLRWRQE